MTIGDGMLLIIVFAAILVAAVGLAIYAIRNRETLFTRDRDDDDWEW